MSANAKSGSGVPPLNLEAQSRDGSATLGHESQNTSSPEGAKEIENREPEADAGQMLLRRILKARREDWRGRGKYKEPVVPDLANLPELPVGWCWAGAEQVTAGIDNAITIGPFGSNLMVKDYQESGVSLIFVREIRSENFRRHDTRYVSPKKAAELSTHKVRGGDVVITKMGEPPGDTAIYPENLPDAIATSDCIKLTPNPKAATATFLKYAIRARPVKDQIERVTRGVAQKKMSLARFKTVAVPLAPLPEQRRIVAEIEKQFTRLEAGVAALRRVQANLKRYRAAVLKAACEGQLVPTEAELTTKNTKSTKTKPVSLSASSALSAVKNPGFESGEQLLKRILAERRQHWTGRGQYKEPAAPDTANLPPLPAGWTWASLEAVSDAVGGYAFSSTKFGEAGYQVVKMANIRMGKIDLTQRPSFISDVTPDIVEKYSLREGDLVVTLTGTRKKRDYGYVAVVKSENGLLLNQRIARVRPFPGMDSRFLQLGMQAEHYRDRFFAHETGNVGQGNVGMAAVTKEVITLPPLAEQTRIVAEVERRLSVVEELESVVSANLQRATRLRQSILQKAFTGELLEVK